jgi:hypothetical protein
MDASFHVDTSRPHPARVYDYMLGGKDHYEVDRLLGEKIAPFMQQPAHENRAFMHRAVAWTAEQGVTQYLDIGTGIPTEPNLHQVVQRIHPAARVVYADRDPIIMRHAEALLVGTPEGTTDYIEADVRDPGVILDAARRSLDFERPVTLSLVAIMHFVKDEYDPYGIVRTLMEALPSGSYLVMSHVSLGAYRGVRVSEEVEAAYTSAIESQDRSPEEIARFFDGLELIEPGVVTTPRWRQDGVAVPDEPHPNFAGVARKR